MTTTDIRQLAGDADFVAANRLGRLAFGADISVPFDPAAYAAAYDRLGAFIDGRLAAKLTVIPYEQWFGGRTVPMGGIAGVAVAAEDRGAGLAGRLLTAALPRMRDRGEVVSTLFPTAVGVYRSAGWELAGTLPRTRVRTSDLLAARAMQSTEPVEIRAAREADVTGIAAAYATRCAGSNGPLTRTGPAFPAGAGEILTLDGGPVAVRNDEVVGFASYSRGRGYGADSELTVHDLIANDPAAATALLHHLGRWASVAPHTTIRMFDDDPWGLLLPASLPAPCEQVRWMLRIVDVAPAIAARGWSQHLSAAVDLDLRDERAPWNAGRWQLRVEAGEGQLISGGSGAVRIDVRGLAALYSSAASTAGLLAAGLLDDCHGDDRSALDAIFAGPRPAILDYF